MIDTLVGQHLGPYELVDRLGAGGMGTVYRAVHGVLLQQRAIKVLRPDLAVSEDAVRRFEREARIAAELHHPNIVQIYDVGAHEGTHFIVMELLPGVTLAEIIRADAPLPLPRAISILQQLADAIDYAHLRGVAHRDVKPGNIVVGAGDRATLVDFGIARIQGATHMTAADMSGTPFYMAPEVIGGATDGRPADEQRAPLSADLYALGVLAYELLAGRVPFYDRTPSRVFLAHVHQPPPPPRSFQPGLPIPVEQVLLRQLAKAPAQRFSNAREFVAALAHAGRIAQAPTMGVSPAGVWPVTPDPTRPIQPPVNTQRPVNTPHPPFVQPPPYGQTPPLQPPVPGATPSLWNGSMPPPVGAAPARRSPSPWRLGGLAVLGLALVMGATVASRIALPTAVPVTPTVVAGDRTTPSSVGSGPPERAVTATATRQAATTDRTTPTPSGPTATPMPTPEQQLQAAKAALFDRDFPRALALLSDLKQAHPSLAGLDEMRFQAHLGYGQHLLAQDNLAESEAQFGQALEIKANDPAAVNGRNQAIARKHWVRMESVWNTNEDEAIASLEAILAIDPEYAGGAARGKLYVKLLAKADRHLKGRQYAPAHQLYQRTAQLQPDAPEAKQRLAMFPPNVPPEQVLVLDGFDDPALGQLRSSWPTPDAASVKYEGGEYVVETLKANYSPAVTIRSDVGNSTVAVDARIVGDPARKFVFLECRAGTSPRSGYRFVVWPGPTAGWRVYKDIGEKYEDVSGWRQSSAIRPNNETNRLLMSCVGDKITVAVNGVELFTFQDPAYTSGWLRLGAGASLDTGIMAEARFDNLVAVQR
jgi:serine/threonine-protein kinase